MNKVSVFDNQFLSQFFVKNDSFKELSSFLLEGSSFTGQRIKSHSGQGGPHDWSLSRFP